MNERIRELAEQAGFVLWPDGQGPFGEVIDWASSYDMELEKFAELVRADEREACAEIHASDMSEKHVHESDKDRHEVEFEKNLKNTLEPQSSFKESFHKEWIGLDPEMMRNTPIEFNRGALWAERWLKEKNHG